MAYSKLHASIVGSSLWTEPDTVRILFITLLALCDRDGIVYGTQLGLNRLANIDMDLADSAWIALLSPDENSSDKMRAPEHEGRRIEEVPGGFRLLNFEYYRSLRNDDDRREQNRVAQAKFKAKVSQGKPRKAEVIPSEAETEAEASTERSLKSQKRVPPSREEVGLLAAKAGLPIEQADAFWEFYDSKGWMVGKNKMVSVASAVAGWARRWRSEQQTRNDVSPTTLAILHQKELDDVAAKMKSIRGSYSEHQDWSEDDKARWYKLKARKDELKKLLGMQV